MVEGYKKNISSIDSKSAPNSNSSELVSWIRSLQQALTVEVDHGFINIQGRTNKFCYFVSGYLLSCPSTAVNQSDCSRLKALALEGNIETSIIQSAMKKYDLDPEKPSPITV